jgi:hypothetical protein
VLVTPNAALTTNHLPKKGDLWLTPILTAHKKTLAAHKNSTSTISSTVSTQHLPASIATWKHWIGIFDPLMMQSLNRQSDQLQAGANYHLLGAMRRIEERDRERFSQRSNE